MGRGVQIVNVGVVDLLVKFFLVLLRVGIFGNFIVLKEVLGKLFGELLAIKLVLFVDVPFAL